MLNERKLTERELDHREVVLQNLLKNKRNLVKRYGKDAEKVMYGIATKKAKTKVEGMNKEQIKELIRTRLEGIDSSPRSNTDDIDSNKSYSSGADYGSEVSATSKEDSVEQGETQPLHYSLEEDGTPQNKDFYADYQDIGQFYLEGFGREHTLNSDQLENLGKKIVDQLYKGDIGKAYDAIVNRDKLDIPGKPKFVKEDYRPSVRAYNVIDKSNNDKIVAKELPRHKALELAKTKKEYMIDATDRLNEALNPEVSRSVNGFIRKMADRYDYSLQDAVNAMMQVLRSQNYDGINEIGMFNDPMSSGEFDHFSPKEPQSKFKRGDEVDYLGMKGEVRSSKYNPFDKSFDYTIAYRGENNIRRSSDGVKDSDLKMLNEVSLDTNIKELNEKLKQVDEKLCKKGDAYRKRRMAAGEKSSAYLSGRAVKVCKGQMSGKKKKK